MSQDYTGFPTEEDAKLDARELMEFLFSGNQPNQYARDQMTIEDAINLAEFAK